MQQLINMFFSARVILEVASYGDMLKIFDLLLDEDPNLTWINGEELHEHNPFDSPGQKDNVCLEYDEDSCCVRSIAPSMADEYGLPVKKISF